MTSPCDLDLAAVGQRLREGSLTATELAEATLDRIAARDRELNAFVHVDRTDVLAQAQAADAALAGGEDRGPLHGVPVALKDLIDVGGMPGRCGSRSVDETPASEDAELAGRLRAAGAIILGKVATYEFALTGPAFDQPYPPARNPWNREHVTGGSSSGSAAAVAGGLVRVAIGTDTGGSIRSPASYCGAVGLKPTRSRVPRRGVFPLSATLDHVGPLAASVAEAALTFDAIADHSEHQPAGALVGRPLDGLRLGYARDWFAADPDTDEALVSAIDDAAAELSRLGARIVPLDLPDYDLFEAAGTVILQAEALDVHRDRLRRCGGLYGRAAVRNLLSGLLLDASDIAAARQLAARLSEELEARLASVDALITATTLTPAPAFAAFAQGPVWTPMRTFPFNVTGHPALSVPCGFVRDLPVGLQILGRQHEEARACQIGHAFERTTAHSVPRAFAPDPERIEA